MASGGEHHSNAETVTRIMTEAARLHSGGDLAGAKAAYERVIDLDPTQATALHLRGVVAHQEGDFESAIDWVSRAVAIDPTAAEAHLSLGQAFDGLGHLDDAAASYRDAIRMDPKLADAHHNLGAVLAGQGEAEDAVGCFRTALDLRPEFAAARLGLAGALADLGRWEAAVEAYADVIARTPDNLIAHYNLGNVYRQQRRLEDAAASYRDALAIAPDAEAFNNLGIVLNDLGDMDGAIASYRRALDERPNFAEAQTNLGVAMQKLGRPDDAIANYRRALEIDPTFSEAGRNLIYALMNVPSLAPAERFAAHREFARAHAGGIYVPAGRLPNEPSPERRLRIAYLSSDFRDHAVGVTIEPLLTNHDHEAFEVFAYADVPWPDEVTARIKDAADHWRDISGISDADVAAMIRADGIDILVSLAGRFDNNRPLVCAHRAAPVQVNMFDVATSGLNQMDYWLTDGYLHPPGTTELSTEKLYRLPVLFQCLPIADAPASPPLPADTAGIVTFGAFNNPAKIGDVSIDLWARVLDAVPDARLVLKYGDLYGQACFSGRIRDGFKARAIDPDRLIFEASRDALAGHLRRYARVDIGLDTFPFNGGTTTFQSLWMGVPVVSLVGDCSVQRTSGTMLRRLRLDDLIAETPDGFVARAQALAEDLPRLRELRAVLRDRVAASSLCDADAYASSVEAAFRDMWRDYCRSAGPQ